jgi:AcrR family transcriptional regulator
MTTREKRTEQITTARRKQILDAALVVFSRKGFGEATIGDVAAEADTGVGTIYNYFKDKRKLLISLIAENLISDKLVRIIEDVPEKNSAEFMRSLMEERLDMGLSNASKLLFLFFEIQRDDKLRQQYRAQVISPLLGMIENYIRAQVANGSFRRVDEKVISRTLAGAIIGNMILNRLERRDSPFKKSHIKQLAQELSNLFIHGLKNS